MGGDNGQHAPIECTVADLHALQREGLIVLTSRESGAVLRSGVDAVESHFERPTHPVVATPIHVHGNVGNIQNGNNNVAIAHHISNLDAAENLDLHELSEQLSVLRSALKTHATTIEQDAAVGAVAMAEAEARKGNRAAASGFLAKAGRWTLACATKIGVSVAAAEIERAIGLGNA
jgi:hypothetical protein